MGHSNYLRAVVTLALAGAPALAAAYVGPGAGLSAIGTFIALIGAILLGIVGFVWYPIKRLLRRRRKPDAEDATPTAARKSERDDADGATPAKPAEHAET